MPEISSTMYPIIIAGAGAIVVLLLVLVVARRRRTRRNQTPAEHDTGLRGAEDDSGVRLIEDDPDAPGEDDDARGGAKRNGRVADGAETSPAADGSPGVAEETETSPPETAGSQGAEAKFGSLVAWGPDETGPERLRAGAEPRAETDRGAPRESEAETPASEAASHSPAETPRTESPFAAELKAASNSGPETPSVESHPPAETGLSPATGAEHPQKESAGPEGQPFERDGRWWFRRDGELLVYDDATSEWKAGPGTGSPPLGTGAPVSAADVDKAARGKPLQGAATTSTIEREAPGLHERPLRPRSEGATFWKCRTCGATNGSAAESCRMCFAARP